MNVPGPLSIKVPIIGVTGPAGVGKDTAARLFVSRYDFVRVALADEMKRIARRLYDFSDLQLWGPSAERNKPDLRYPRGNVEVPCPGQEHCAVARDEAAGGGGTHTHHERSFLSPRIALQVLGTEFGRNCYVNTWVDLLLRDARTLLSGGWDYHEKTGMEQAHITFPPFRGVVIPDCRFRNEIEAVQAAGGIVIRLRRKTAADALTVGVKNHASEAEQLSIPDSAFDLVVECAEGVREFHRQLADVFDQHLTITDCDF